MNKNKLLERLEPFATGCFSGNVSDWPQLKPLLSDLYTYLTELQDLSDKDYPDHPCKFAGTCDYILMICDECTEKETR